MKRNNQHKVKENTSSADVDEIRQFITEAAEKVLSETSKPSKTTEEVINIDEMEPTTVGLPTAPPLPKLHKSSRSSKRGNKSRKSKSDRKRSVARGDTGTVERPRGPKRSKSGAYSVTSVKSGAVERPRNGPARAFKQSVKSSNHVNNEEMKLLKQVYPCHDIIQGDNNPHPHLVSALVRREGEDLMIKMIREEGSKRGVILDVGGSFRCATKGNIHCCENGTTLEVRSKIKDWARRSGNMKNVYVFGDSVTRRPPSMKGWTACRCDAASCYHCNTVMEGVARPQAAMFNHSVYYNTPEKVARICLRCTSRTAYSQHHVFHDNEGYFYYHGPKHEKLYPSYHGFESRYVVKGNDVHMSVAGNEHSYSHSNIRWLTEKTRCRVNVDGNDYWLFWKKPVRQSDHTQQTVIVKFELFECEDGEQQGELPPVFVEPCEEEDPDEPENQEFPEFEYIAKRAKIRYCGKHFLYCIYEEKEVRFPRALVAEAVRYLLDKTLEGETYVNLIHELKRKAVDYRDKVPYLTLVRDVPVLATLAIEHDLEAHTWARKFFSTERVKEIKQHNKYLAWDFYRMNLPRFCTVGACILLMLMTFSLMIPAYFMGVWYVVGALVLSTCVNSLSSGVIVYIIAQLNPVNCLDAASHAAAGSILTVILFLILLIFVLLYLTKPVINPFMAFEAYKRSVENSRRTIKREGPVPDGAYISSFETWINPEDYPQAPGSKVTKISHRKKTRRKRGIGAFVYSIIFTAAAPLVFSTSVWNLFVAILTRTTVQPPHQAVPGYWTWATGYLRLDIYGTPDGPRSKTESFKTTKEHKQPDKIVWSKGDYGYFGNKVISYLDRFPKGKIAKIVAAAMRVTEALVTLKHFVYNAFVKREKLNKITFDPFEPVRPRTIQGASEYTKKVSGPWFLAYSYALKFCLNPTTHIWYCSGYNSDTFNWWIQFHLMRLGTELVFCGTDFSKYDVTQGADCISGECNYYIDLGILNLPGGKFIIKSKVHTKGFGAGVRYTVWFTRKSGDNDTSSGNSRNTAIAIVSFLEGVLGLNPSQYAVAVLGDDNFMMVKESAINMDTFEQQLVAHMTSLGFSVKAEVTRDLCSTEFLSRRFYPVGNKYVIGRKPGRVLAKLGYTLSRLAMKVKTREAILKGTLLSMLSESNHVPFLRVYVQVCLEQLLTVKARFDVHDKLALAGKMYEPTRETYQAFERVYGLTKTDELRFEKRIRSAVRRDGLMTLVHSPEVIQLLKVDQSGP